MWIQEVLLLSLHYFISISSHLKCFKSPTALSKIRKVLLQYLWLLTNYQHLNFFRTINDKLILTYLLNYSVEQSHS